MNLIRIGRWGLNPDYVREFEVSRLPMGLGSTPRVVVTVGDGPTAKVITFDGDEADEFLRLIQRHVRR